MAVLDLHRQAMAEFGERVRAVRADQWQDVTPCTEWDVRALVNHVTVEQLWVPLLLDGVKPDTVADSLEDDLLGDDPMSTWERASEAARVAWTAPGVLERNITLSNGPTPAEIYVWQATLDLGVHAWDLARAVGAGEQLDGELVAALRQMVEPRVRQVQSSGLFAAPLLAATDATDQQRLLALLGRAS